MHPLLYLAEEWSFQLQLPEITRQNWAYFQGKGKEKVHCKLFTTREEGLCPLGHGCSSLHYIEVMEGHLST